MKPWHRKLIVDTAKSVIPFKRRLRELKRRHFPYSTDIANDRTLLADGIELIRMIRGAGYRVDGADIIEFGSGWLPLIPFLLLAAGAKSVTLTDQERLLDCALARKAAEYLCANARQITSDLGLTEIQLRGKLSPLLSADGQIDNVFKKCGLTYLVPFRSQDLPSHSADIIVSRAVLEHVPEPVLCTFVKEFGRILLPGGIMCHIIDLSDHWEHKDKSISRVNFLKFDDLFWRVTCLNPQNYQNRLRRHQYLKIFSDCGFEIISQRGEADPSSLEALRDLPIASRFRSVPREELAVISCAVVAKTGSSLLVTV